MFNPLNVVICLCLLAGDITIVADMLALHGVIICINGLDKNIATTSLSGKRKGECKALPNSPAVRTTKQPNRNNLFAATEQVTANIKKGTAT